MEAMSVGINRLCQMVHDTGLWHGTEDPLQRVLATGWFMAIVDAIYDSQLDKMIIATIKRFIVVKKLADDFDISIQLTRPGSAMPATLNGHYGDNLFDALVAL